MVKAHPLYIFLKSLSPIFPKDQIKIIPMIVEYLFQFGDGNVRIMKADIAFQVIQQSLFLAFLPGTAADR